MSALIVSANGIPVGTLEIENGRWKFIYAAEWNDYALSPNFPITARKFEDTADAKPVEWFFENLLPEGRLRDLIASRDRIAPRDTWALLIRHGQDTAGALSLIPEGFDVATEEILVPLAREALQERKNPGKVPGIAYRDRETGSVVITPKRAYANLDSYPCFNPEKLRAPIEISRGCPWGCKYCQTPRLFGREVRHRIRQ